MDAGEGITALRRLRGVVLRESTYELVLEAMPKAKPPYDTLTTFIDNAVELHARTLLSNDNQTHRPGPTQAKPSPSPRTKE